MANPDTALIVVDMQNDFIDGELVVPGAWDIIAPINRLTYQYPLVIATQDWHPSNHSSFAQWPKHCVQGSYGAEFVGELDKDNIHIIWRKGMLPNVDAYSPFRDNAGTDSGLQAMLRGRGITHVHVCGVAREYCVAETAKDANYFLFNTTILEEVTRGLANE